MVASNDPPAPKRSLNRRTLVAGTTLLSLSGFIASQHQGTDRGLGEQDFASATVLDAIQAGQEGDVLLLDMVEPEDGEGGSQAEIEALIAGLDLQAEAAGFYSEGEHLYRVHGTPEQLGALRDRLQGNALVEGIEADLLYNLPDHTFSASEDPGVLPGEESPNASKKKKRRPLPRFQPNDPMYPLQWHLDAIHVPEAWTLTRGEGAVVAVIDTGVAWKDLQWGKFDAKKVPDLEGVQFVDAATFLDNAMPEGLDDHAHGTHVAGTIAQATDNGLGVAGVAYKAKIMPLKVLSGDGRGSVAGIANAIRYAADHDADVINMSLGGPLPSRIMAKAVAYAHDKGTTVICAAGNEKRSRVSYPAAYEGSVSVAATNWQGSRSFYSNWGKKLDISAPGGDMRDDKNGDGHPDGVLQNTIKIQDPEHHDFLWFQGTSMAAPHAAGVAALVVSQGITNPAEVERILKETAVHPDGVRWDKNYGAGIIDAHKAVIASRKDYEPERLGFLAVLGFMGLGGRRCVTSSTAIAASATRLRHKLGPAAGWLAGAALGAGGVGTPLAYNLGLGSGLLGSGLLLSAFFPLVATLLLMQYKKIRVVLAGLNLGWAALLAHGAVVLPTLLTGIPGGTGWDRAFLALNAGLCLFVATRLGRTPEKFRHPGQI